MNPYLQHFELAEPLFVKTLEADACFWPQRMVLPLEHLLLSLAHPQALAVVIGGAGVGKSTALRWLLRQLPAPEVDSLTLDLIRRESRAGWLTPRLAQHLGLRSQDPAPAQPSLPTSSALLRLIAARLDEYRRLGRRLVLAIDNAHLAQGKGVFDEIIALLRLSGQAEVPLQVVLLGLGALEQQLRSTEELLPLLSYLVEISPLRPQETAAYIEHRLRIGKAQRISFEQEALAIIHAASGGVIAGINRHAESCLILAYQRGTYSISGQIALAARPLPDPAASNFVGLPERGASLQDLVPPPPPPRLDQSVIKSKQINDIQKMGEDLPPNPEGVRQEAVADAESSSISLASLFKSDGTRHKP